VIVNTPAPDLTKREDYDPIATAMVEAMGEEFYNGDVEAAWRDVLSDPPLVPRETIHIRIAPICQFVLDRQQDEPTQDSLVVFSPPNISRNS